MTRYDEFTDRAHVAKEVIDWHRVVCGDKYVDIHKLACFGDRDYSWVFVFTIGDEVAMEIYATDEQAKLPEQELKQFAQGYVSSAVTKLDIRHSLTNEIKEKRAAK